MALRSATSQLPVLVVCKTSDILKHTTQLGSCCVQGQSGSLSTFQGWSRLLTGYKSRHCNRETVFTDLSPSSKRTLNTVMHLAIYACFGRDPDTGICHSQANAFLKLCALEKKIQAVFQSQTYFSLVLAQPYQFELLEG